MKKTSLLFLVFTIVFYQFVSSQGYYKGFTLYAPGNSTTAYLIDMDNNIVHTWSLNHSPADKVYLLENGHLLATGMDPSAQLNGGAVGGYIEEYDWDGNLQWQYNYSSSNYCLHHDICPLPNGNVLAIAWEVKTASEAQAQGSSSSSEVWPTHIIEVEKTGTYTGNIVWEWHLWDHLVQDYDNSKPNYGVVADHPELMNINNTDGTKGGIKPPPPGGGDWLHSNHIDYNDSLDQICFSSHTLMEVYVIDHSTTTAEAATHTGGNSGKGGDFLYRWGNPQGYDQGTSSDQVFYVVHGGHWIPYGLPGGGDFMAFNNGDGRPGGNSSSADEWTPPVDAYGNYSYTTGTAFVPSNLTWTHTCTNYSAHLSFAQRLPNGNTMITEGPSGHFYEIDSSETTVWEYSVGTQECTKAIRYGCNYPGLANLNLDCNCDIDGTAYYDSCDDCVGGNTGLEPCVTGVDNVSLLNDVGIYPNPSKGIFHIYSSKLKGLNYRVLVYNVMGEKVKEFSNTRIIDLSSLNNGIYSIDIIAENTKTISRKKVSLIK